MPSRAGAGSRKDDLNKLKAQLEEQKRLVKVEVALEKVRSGAMAMRESGELAETSAELFRQLKKLGIRAVRTGLGIFDDDHDAIELWMTTVAENKEVVRMLDYVNMHVHPVFEHVMLARKQQKSFAFSVLKGHQVQQYYETMHVYLGLLDPSKLNPVEYHYAFFFAEGAINVVTSGALTKEESSIMIRVAGVFGLIYTRFLDLQKAEAQARDAQIEAALERVRTRTMAMRKSDELREVVFEYYKQVTLFGFAKWGFEIKIAKEDKSGFYCWISPPGARIQPDGFDIPTLDHWVLEKYWSAFEQQSPILSVEVSGEDMTKLSLILLEQSDMKHLPESVKANILETDYVHFSVAAMRFGLLKAVDIEPVSNQDISILQRFAKAFEQTYTRFLDLRKAEAQTREAQIEAALERVRSRSMAMHKSEELLQVITVVSDQLQQLNLRFNTVSFAVNNQYHDYKFWFAVVGNPNPVHMQVPYLPNPMFDRVKEVLAKGTAFYADTLTPEESRQWHEHVFAHADLTFISEERKSVILRSGYARSVAIMPNIMLIVSNYYAQPYTDDENDIIKKFASVFEQSYTRFLDLQRAEALAREAQIEAALERVRGKAMALRSSNELREVIAIIFEEMGKLGFDLYDSNIAIRDGDTKDLTYYGSGLGGIDMPPEFRIPYLPGHHQYMDSVYSDLGNEAVFKSFEFSGETLKELQRFYIEKTGFGNAPAEYLKEMLLPTTVVLSYATMDHGLLEVASYEPLDENRKDVLIRFAKVIDLTYTRFDDLLKAEANARDALRQSSLDRVRAETASMRTTADLERITPLIWNELTTLCVPFVRCGVFIMDEQQQRIHTFLSTPDGKAIASFDTPFSNPGTLTETLPYWRRKEIYKAHWDETAFLAQAKTLMDQGAISSPEMYLTENRPTDLHLHFLPFMQGMLYVGNAAPLSDRKFTIGAKPC